MKEWFNQREFNYILIWILILLNLLIIVWWLVGLSSATLLTFGLLAIAGTIMVLLLTRERPAFTASESVLEELTAATNDFQPMADKIIEEVWQDKVVPVADAAKTELGKSLEWLEENSRSFARQILNGLAEVQEKLFFSSGVTLSDELYQLQKKMEERVELTQKFLNGLETGRLKSLDELELYSSRQLKQVRESLEHEGKIVEQYLERTLAMQMETRMVDNDEKLVPQMERMAEQFTVLITSSVDDRVRQLEQVLADMVDELAARAIGAMQKEALSQVSGLRQISGDVEKLWNRPRGPRERLEAAGVILQDLRKQVNDTLITLAWEDVLIEKRWEEMLLRLEKVEQELLQDVEAAKLAEVQASLRQELSSLITTEEYPSWLELIITAELMYDYYQEGLLIEISGEGSYVVLQFVRAVEEMVRASVALPADLLAQRRQVKDQVREGAYNHVFEQVLAEITKHRPGVKAYLEDVYPNGFYSFCLTPGISYQPSNCGQAAWMLYLYLMTQVQQESEDAARLTLLSGLLLALHTLRNRYVHPSHSTIIIPVKDLQDIDEARFCTLTAIDLLLQLEL